MKEKRIYKYIPNKFERRGMLSKVPRVIIDNMIAEQVRQGNCKDVTVFERKINSALREGGFAWGNALYNTWGIVCQEANPDYGALTREIRDRKEKGLKILIGGQESSSHIHTL